MRPLGTYYLRRRRPLRQPQPQPQPAICVTSLLAHLLFLVANGGFDSGGGTALADTFATSSFVAVAAAADVPDEMRSDVAARWGHAIHPRAKCFDLFRCEDCVCCTQHSASLVVDGLFNTHSLHVVLNSCTCAAAAWWSCSSGTKQ